MNLWESSEDENNSSEDTKDTASPEPSEVEQRAWIQQAFASVAQEPAPVSSVAPSQTLDRSSTQGSIITLSDSLHANPQALFGLNLNIKSDSDALAVQHMQAIAKLNELGFKPVYFFDKTTNTVTAIPVPIDRGPVQNLTIVNLQPVKAPEVAVKQDAVTTITPQPPVTRVEVPVTNSTPVERPATTVAPTTVPSGSPVPTLVDPPVQESRPGPQITAMPKLYAPPEVLPIMPQASPLLQKIETAQVVVQEGVVPVSKPKEGVLPQTVAAEVTPAGAGASVAARQPGASESGSPDTNLAVPLATTTSSVLGGTARVTTVYPPEQTATRQVVPAVQPEVIPQANPKGRTFVQSFKAFFGCDDGGEVCSRDTSPRTVPIAEPTTRRDKSPEVQFVSMPVSGTQVGRTGTPETIRATSTIVAPIQVFIERANGLLVPATITPPTVPAKETTASPLPIRVDVTAPQPALEIPRSTRNPESPDVTAGATNAARVTNVVVINTPVDSTGRPTSTTAFERLFQQNKIDPGTIVVIRPTADVIPTNIKTFFENVTPVAQTADGRPIVRTPGTADSGVVPPVVGIDQKLPPTVARLVTEGASPTAKQPDVVSVALRPQGDTVPARVVPEGTAPRTAGEGTTPRTAADGTIIRTVEVASGPTKLVDASPIPVRVDALPPVIRNVSSSSHTEATLPPVTGASGRVIAEAVTLPKSTDAAAIGGEIGSRTATRTTPEVSPVPGSRDVGPAKDAPLLPPVFRAPEPTSVRAQNDLAPASLRIPDIMTLATRAAMEPPQTIKTAEAAPFRGTTGSAVAQTPEVATARPADGVVASRVPETASGSLPVIRPLSDTTGQSGSRAPYDASQTISSSTARILGETNPRLLQALDVLPASASDAISRITSQTIAQSAPNRPLADGSFTPARTVTPEVSTASGTITPGLVPVVYRKTDEAASSGARVADSLPLLPTSTRAASTDAKLPPTSPADASAPRTLPSTFTGDVGESVAARRPLGVVGTTDITASGAPRQVATDLSSSGMQGIARSTNTSDVVGRSKSADATTGETALVQPLRVGNTVITLQPLPSASDMLPVVRQTQLPLTGATVRSAIELPGSPILPPTIRTATTDSAGPADLARTPSFTTKGMAGSVAEVAAGTLPQASGTTGGRTVDRTPSDTTVQSFDNSKSGIVLPADSSRAAAPARIADGTLPQILPPTTSSVGGRHTAGNGSTRDDGTPIVQSVASEVARVTTSGIKGGTNFEPAGPADLARTLPQPTTSAGELGRTLPPILPATTVPVISAVSESGLNNTSRAGDRATAGSVAATGGTDGKFSGTRTDGLAPAKDQGVVPAVQTTRSATELQPAQVVQPTQTARSAEPLGPVRSADSLGTVNGRAVELPGTARSAELPGTARLADSLGTTGARSAESGTARAADTLGTAGTTSLPPILRADGLTKAPAAEVGSTTPSRPEGSMGRTVGSAGSGSPEGTLPPIVRAGATENAPPSIGRAGESTLPTTGRAGSPDSTITTNGRNAEATLPATGRTGSGEGTLPPVLRADGAEGILPPVVRAGVEGRPVPSGDIGSRATTSLPERIATFGTTAGTTDGRSAAPIAPGDTCAPRTELATTGRQVVDAATGRQAVDAATGRQAVDAATGRQVADATTGRQAVDATAGRPAVDGTTGRQVADATTGRPVVDATTGRPVVDATTGRPVIDTTTGRQITENTSGRAPADTTKAPDSTGKTIFDAIASRVLDGTTKPADFGTVSARSGEPRQGALPEIKPTDKVIAEVKPGETNTIKDARSVETRIADLRTGEVRTDATGRSTTFVSADGKTMMVDNRTGSDLGQKGTKEDPSVKAEGEWTIREHIRLMTLQTRQPETILGIKDGNKVSEVRVDGKPQDAIRLDGIKAQDGIRIQEGTRLGDTGRVIGEVKGQDGIRIQDGTKAQDGVRIQDGTKAQDGVRIQDGTRAQDGVRMQDSIKVQDGGRVGDTGRVIDVKPSDIKNVDIKASDIKGSEIKNVDIKGSEIKNAEVKNIDIKAVDQTGKGIKDVISGVRIEKPIEIASSIGNSPNPTSNTTGGASTSGTNVIDSATRVPQDSSRTPDRTTDGTRRTDGTTAGNDGRVADKREIAMVTGHADQKQTKHEPAVKSEYKPEDIKQTKSEPAKADQNAGKPDGTKYDTKHDPKVGEDKSQVKHEIKEPNRIFGTVQQPTPGADKDPYSATAKNPYDSDRREPTEKTSQIREPKDKDKDQKDPKPVVLVNPNAKKKQPQNKGDNTPQKKPELKAQQKRKQYVVKAGDTLESIAEEQCKDVRYAPLLLTINRGSIRFKRVAGRKGQPDLRPGQIIHLPTHMELQMYNMTHLGYSAGSNSISATAPKTHKNANEAPITDEDFHLPEIDIIAGDNSDTISTSCADSTATTLIDREQSVMAHSEVSKLMIPQYGSQPNFESPISIALSKIRHAGNRPISLQMFEEQGRCVQLMNRFEEIAVNIEEQQISAPLAPSAVSPEQAEDDGYYIDISLHVNTLSETCRIVTADPGIGATTFNARLQTRVDGVWMTVACYEFRQGLAHRFSHYANGDVRPFPLDLPVNIIREMAREDFTRNWTAYCREFYKRPRKGGAPTSTSSTSSLLG